MTELRERRLLFLLRLLHSAFAVSASRPLGFSSCRWTARRRQGGGLVSRRRSGRSSSTRCWSTSTWRRVCPSRRSSWFLFGGALKPYLHDPGTTRSVIPFRFSPLPRYGLICMPLFRSSSFFYVLDIKIDCFSFCRAYHMLIKHQLLFAFVNFPKCFVHFCRARPRLVHAMIHDLCL